MPFVTYPLWLWKVGGAIPPFSSISMWDLRTFAIVGISPHSAPEILCWSPPAMGLSWTRGSHFKYLLDPTCNRKSMMINRIFRSSTRFSDFSPKLFEQSPWIFGRQVPMFFADITRTPWDTAGHPALALPCNTSVAVLKFRIRAMPTWAMHFAVDFFTCLTYRWNGSIHISLDAYYLYLYLSYMSTYIYIYISCICVLSLCVCAEWKGWTLTRCLSVSQLFEAFLNNDVLFGKIPRGPILDSICNHLPYPSIHPSIHPSMYLYMCISVYNLWIHILIYIYTSPYCFWWRLISEYPSCFIDQCWGSCNAVYHWASMSFWVVPRELSS